MYILQVLDGQLQRPLILDYAVFSCEIYSTLPFQPLSVNMQELTNILRNDLLCTIHD